MEGLTEMAEDMLKTGTPEERAEARQYLEENKVLIAEQKARARAPTPPVKAAVAPRQGTVKHTMKSVTYMSRIGNCKG